MQKGEYYTTINEDEVPVEQMVSAIANTIKAVYPLVYETVNDAQLDIKPDFQGDPKIRFFKLTFEEIDPKDYLS